MNKPEPAGQPKPRRHLMIAGTGRAGTSMLVRFLAEMGLETHLAKSGETHWHDEANAGLEDIPLAASSGDLPYVIKTPFLSEIIDDVLADPGTAIDAVIIPVRDLAEAAASRAVVELQAVHQREPWVAALDRMVESWGVTPGGIVYSLNPLDQGRLLAVGFHRLIERLTRADIAMVFLDFPRLAEDPAYLFRKLQPWLPAGSGEAQAAAAHARTADATKIRIGGEIQGPAGESRHGGTAYPDLDRLDLIAMRRELRRLQAQPQAGSGSVRREQELGQREILVGQRESTAGQREQELARQADDLARRGEELERRAREMIPQDATPAETGATQGATGSFQWIARLTGHRQRPK